jgi:hypothetical protein
MHGYCPLCYKGEIGVSGATLVPEGDARVDAEQAELSRRGNGLAILDLDSPGEPCRHSRMCRVRCLVCGKSMADGDDPAFEQLLELLEELEATVAEYEAEVAGCGLNFLAESMGRAMRRNRRKELRRFGLDWIDRWSRPAHSRCVKEAGCGCVLQVHAEVCLAHKRHAPRRARVAPVVTLLAAPASAALPTLEPVITDMMARSGGGVPVPHGVTTETASWLPVATKMARITSYVPPPARPPPFAKKKRPPPPPVAPPLAHTNAGKLLGAASTCHKLDGWASGKSRMGAAAASATLGKSAGGGPAAKYDFKTHDKTYDPFVHGPFRKDGQYWYLRPDGKAVRASEGVSQFTETGELVPC